MYAEIWKSPRNGQWYWHIRGRNHEIVTQSEGYVSRQGALHGLSLVIGNRNIPIYEV